MPNISSAFLHFLDSLHIFFVYFGDVNYIFHLLSGFFVHFSATIVFISRIIYLLFLSLCLFFEFFSKLCNFYHARFVFFLIVQLIMSFCGVSFIPVTFHFQNCFRIVTNVFLCIFVNPFLIFLFFIM